MLYLSLTQRQTKHYIISERFEINPGCQLTRGIPSYPSLPSSLHRRAQMVGIPGHEDLSLVV